MNRDRASITASIVAAARSAGACLPDEQHIARDPHGARFADPLTQAVLHRPALVRAALRVPPFAGWVLYMQVRTRALDDVLLAFARDGGAQVVLLGAGFDCRAHRFGDALRGVTFWEVDHPSTQERKRREMEGRPGAPVRYMSWDFEHQPVSELPSALAAAGHTTSSPTLTIWEGVTMYLTEQAIEHSVQAIRTYSAPASLLALTYFEPRRLLQRPTPLQRIVRGAVRTFGEPWRWGWNEGDLAPWLAGRGLEVVTDASESALATRLLPPEQARQVKPSGRRIAVARVR